MMERSEALTGAELEPADEREEQVVSRPEAPEPAHGEELAPDTVDDEAGLVVRVTEESDATPVAGLDVRLSYEQGGEQTERMVVTDDEGEARFEFGETVELRVVYADPGERTTPARSWLRRSLPSGERMELELVVSEGGTLAGVVLDQDEVPVPNAEVLGWHRYFDEPCQSTRSGADGAFTLEHLGANFYVTARTPRLACRWGVRGDLAAGASVEGLEIRFAFVESLHGVVLTPELTPIGGAELSVSHALGTSASYLLTDTPGILRFHAGQSEGVSDGQGRFELVGLSRGQHGVRVEIASYLAYREFHDTGAQPAEIVLDPGLQLSGRVFDTHGLPATGARVRFWPCYSNMHTVECSELCDESGRFTLPSLVREANHAIAIRHEGHAVLVVQPIVPGPDGGEFVEVQLDPEEVIAGRVVGQEVDEAELQRRLQGMEEVENRTWFAERQQSGAVAFAETRIEVEVVDGSDIRRGHVVLTPKGEGGYREESRTWLGDQTIRSSSEPPVPAFNLTLPAGSLTLRAQVEGYPDLELSLQLQKDERRRQALVLRRR